MIRKKLFDGLCVIVFRIIYSDSKLVNINYVHNYGYVYLLCTYEVNTIYKVY